MSELIDRQAFIENERKLYCEDCDRRKGTKNGKPNVICYEIGEAPCRACWLDDALGDLEDFPAASPWHRVEEELPRGQELVIVAIKDTAGDTPFWYTQCGWITTDGEYWIVDNEICGYVVAWMPLPEPPKEDA